MVSYLISFTRRFAKARRGPLLERMNKMRSRPIIALALSGLLLTGGIASAAAPGAAPSNVKVVAAASKTMLVPSAPGTNVQKNDRVVIDISNTAQGYVMVKYTGQKSKIKVQVVKAGGSTYTYDLAARDAFETFPLSEGNGSYTVKVLENVSGTSYAMAHSASFDVKLLNDFLPFLYPNQYVNFTTNSNVVKQAAALAKGQAKDLDIVKSVYNYVVDNISYDYDLAKNVQSGYLPKVDEVLQKKKGICFDYAAVMSAMLRSQGIPCKLVIGYAGDVYHAWINIYLEEQGWVDGLIYFDGQDWKLMDPTFASSGKNSETVQKYITNPANYKSKYAY